MVNKGMSLHEAFEEAQAAALPGEELKKNNFQRVDTYIFERGVITLKQWLEMVLNEMIHQDSLRIEINYNAGLRKTSFALYTPKEDAKDDTKQEYPECQDQ